MKQIAFVLAICSLPFTLQAQDAITPAAKGVTYGAGTTKKGATTVAKMEQTVQTTGQFTGKITAKVTEVCLEKGCWMRVEKGNGETMIVRFKDYGFFMPKNIVGHTVVLEGEAKQKEVSVAQQRHFAEDAGKSKEEIEKITQPKNETQFIASGVLVIK
ncbi:MAG: DUF4920 domain-containing protein [Lacibacter sp.]